MTTAQLLTAVLERHTQQHVADLLGVTTRTLRNWQRGTTTPPKFVAVALQKLLADYDWQQMEDRETVERDPEFCVVGPKGTVICTNRSPELYERTLRRIEGKSKT